MFETPQDERIYRLKLELDRLSHCDHRNVEIRYREASNGNRMYARQCLDCGELLKTEAGLWIKKDKVLNNVKTQPIDDNIKANRGAITSEMRQALQERLRAAQNDWRTKQYQAYLGTPEWKEKRRRVMQRAGYLCEGCQEDPAEVVHHKTYSNIYNEFLFELVALCRNCHERIHQINGDTERATRGDRNE